MPKDVQVDCAERAFKKLTNRDVRVRCDRELPHNALRRYPRLVEMPQHLVRLRFRRPIRGPDLDRMVLAVVAPNGFYVCGHLAIFELE